MDTDNLNNLQDSINQAAMVGLVFVAVVVGISLASLLTVALVKLAAYRR